MLRSLAPSPLRVSRGFMLQRGFIGSLRREGVLLHCHLLLLLKLVELVELLLGGISALGFGLCRVVISLGLLGEYL